MAKNVVYVYCEEDKTRTCWVLSSVLLKFSISYLGSRKMGTVLAHVGHGACPKWAQPVSKMCPKRFKDETPEKGMKNHQCPDDTSMIL